MHQAYTMIEEGQDLDEIIEGGPPAPPPNVNEPDEDPDFEFERPVDDEE